MPVSAEGRVEHQKLNQTAALLSFGWDFGFQLDLLEKNLVTLPELTFTFTVGFAPYQVFNLTGTEQLRIFGTAPIFQSIKHQAPSQLLLIVAPYLFFNHTVN